MPNPYTLDTLPAKGVFTITPADGAGLQWATPARGFYVGGGTGTITAISLDGVQFDMAGLVTGQIYQIGLLRVLATGTGATNIRGLI